MLAQINSTLLVYGLGRAAFALILLAIGVRKRRVIPALLGLFITFNSIVFAITNAHGHVAEGLNTTAVLLSTPVVALIIAGVLVAAPMERVHGRWWL